MASYPLGINPKTEKQYKVMIVDDSSTIRIAEKKILLSENFNVMLEADGAMTALKQLKESPDMPQMNGIDLLKRIRALNYEGKVIVVTSYANKGILSEFLKLKIDGYVVKPVQRQTIIQHLAKVLGRDDYIK